MASANKTRTIHSIAEDSDYANNVAKLIGPVSVLIAIFSVLYYFIGLTYSKDFKLVCAYFIAILFSRFLQRTSKFSFENYLGYYLTGYHLLLSILLIFIVPTQSYFVFVWILLLYFTEYFYNFKGLLFSTSWLLFTLIYGVFYQNNGMTQVQYFESFSIFIIIMSVHSLMTYSTFGNKFKIKELSQRQNKSENEYARLSALLNSINDAVITTNEKGTIVNYNAAALDLLDTHTVLLGLPINMVMKVTNQIGDYENLLDIAKTTHAVQKRSDLILPLDSKEKISLEITINAIANPAESNQNQGYVFLIRDITKQKSLDEEKDLFISEVSHELRTPLTIAEATMSMAELLVDKKSPDIKQIKESVGKSHEQIVFLSEMVNDLSALSRAQNTDSKLEIQSFNIADILSELEETYLPQAVKKGLYFKVQVASPAPTIQTSRLYFKEIMQNFITNAIKYTPKGGVTLKSQIIDNDKIKIDIIDTGLGIAKSEQEKVFHKFWRSEDALTQETNGTGLGLYITTKLIKRLGGKITLDSKLKVGSTFSVILPLVLENKDTKDIKSSK